MTSRRSKYNARKVTIDGVTFDSAGEAKRWRQLQLLQRAGVIKGLGDPHPSFPITINGRQVCKVYMDFAYSENGQNVVEDFKGRDLPMSRLKRKILAAAYPHLTIKLTGPAAEREARKKRARVTRPKAKGRGR